MPQGNPEGYLTEELMQEPGQQPVKQEGSVSDLRPLVQDPMGDFVVTLLEFADRYGVLDESMSRNSEEETIDERLDALSGDAFLQMLSKEDIDLLISKFEAIPPEQQQMLLNILKEEAPNTYTELVARFRLVRGRDNVAQRVKDGQQASR